MKTLTVDGKEHVFFLERGAGDDGLIVNYLAPNSDGTFTNYREWYAASLIGKAQADYDAIDDAKAREALTMAVARDAANRINIGKT